MPMDLSELSVTINVVTGSEIDARHGDPHNDDLAEDRTSAVVREINYKQLHR